MNMIPSSDRTDTTRSGQQAPAASASSDEIDLGRMLLSVWAGKTWIMAFTVLALAVGVFNYANSPLSYRSDSLLQLEERGGRLALPSSMRDLVDSSPRVVTEIEIVRSRMVLGQVVADLNLDWEASPMLMPYAGTLMSRYNLPIPEFGFLEPYVRKGDEITLGFLEVPPHWVGQRSEVFITEDGFRVTTPDGAEHEGVVGQMLRDDETGFALRIDALSGPAGRGFHVRQIEERVAINRLRSGLSVAERGRGSGMLEFQFTDRDPERAARVLNGIGQIYVRQNIQRSAAEAESGLEFIESQLPEAEANLREAELALNRYRQEHSAVDLSFETRNLLTEVTRIESELRELQAREDEVSERYTPSHPTYRQLLSERARLEDRLESLRGEVGNLPQTQREVLNLTRDLELAQQVHTGLLTRAQEVRVLMASSVGNVRVVDPAVVQRGPVAPQRNRILAVAVVLGALFGVGFVMVRGWMRKGIQNAEEIEEMGLPVFATINYTPHADFKHKRKGWLPVLATTEPTDLTIEAFRSLRTSLHFGMLDARTNSIAISSAAPEAGKSFTSVNLAAVAAEAGLRVCLVDGDMRRGQLRRYFKIERNQQGLAELLSGATTLEEVMIPTEIEGLTLIVTGRYPPNPSELLMRSELPQLLQRLDEQFDLIIVDCPPVLAVTDPVIIGRAVGANILVARFDKTPPAELRAVRKSMEAAGVRPAGVVLNGFDPRKAAATYGYCYSYRYEYRRPPEG